MGAGSAVVVLTRKKGNKNPRKLNASKKRNDADGKKNCSCSSSFTFFQNTFCLLSQPVHFGGFVFGDCGRGCAEIQLIQRESRHDDFTFLFCGSR